MIQRGRIYLDELGTSDKERSRVIDVFDDLHGTYHIKFLITFQEFLRRNIPVAE